jgi:hypothetical protein
MVHGMLIVGSRTLRTIKIIATSAYRISARGQKQYKFSTLSFKKACDNEGAPPGSHRLVEPPMPQRGNLVTLELHRFRCVLRATAFS